MKSIKDHIMFILPLMAMLIGIEFILIFNRVTSSYEQRLKDDYAILVTAKQELSIPLIKSINDNIDNVEIMDREQIKKEVTAGMQDDALIAMIKELPYFYRVHINSYLPIEDIKKIQSDLEKVDGVLKVDIFGENYHSKHTMYILVKMMLNIFIVMLFIVSIMLVVKQMQVWQLAHKERMQIMEIFGAPLMLRSGVLFKIAFIDALFATILNVVFFTYLKDSWAKSSEIELIKNNIDQIFSVSDFFILFIIAIFIVSISVIYVAISTRERPEG